MKMRLWHMKVLGSALVSSTMACGSASGGGDKPVIVAKGVALHRADSCDDLLTQIQGDALAKLDDVIKNYQENRYYYYYNNDNGRRPYRGASLFYPLSID